MNGIAPLGNDAAALMNHIAPLGNDATAFMNRNALLANDAAALMNRVVPLMSHIAAIENGNAGAEDGDAASERRLPRGIRAGRSVYESVIGRARGKAPGPPGGYRFAAQPRGWHDMYQPTELIR